MADGGGVIQAGDGWEVKPRLFRRPTVNWKDGWKGPHQETDFAALAQGHRTRGLIPSSAVARRPLGTVPVSWPTCP